MPLLEPPRQAFCERHWMQAARESATPGFVEYIFSDGSSFHDPPTKSKIIRSKNESEMKCLAVVDGQPSARAPSCTSASLHVTSARAFRSMKEWSDQILRRHEMDIKARQKLSRNYPVPSCRSSPPQPTSPSTERRVLRDPKVHRSKARRFRLL